MNGAEFWGVAWAMIAAIGGTGLLVVAITLLRRAVRVVQIDMLEFDGGYNALAPQLDR
jgi:hypothetical protein